MCYLQVSATNKNTISHTSSMGNTTTARTNLMSSDKYFLLKSVSISWMYVILKYLQTVPSHVVLFYYEFINQESDHPLCQTEIST